MNVDRRTIVAGRLLCKIAEHARREAPVPAPRATTERLRVQAQGRLRADVVREEDAILTPAVLPARV